MIKNIFLYSLLFFLSVNFIKAQTPYLLSVNELFEKGIQNSLDLKSAYLNKDIAIDNISLAKNKKIADISSSASFGYVGTPILLNTDFSYHDKSDVADWQQTYQVSVSQPIYQGGRIKNNINKAKLEKEITELVITKSKSDLKLWLINDYLNLYNLYKQKDIYTVNIEEATKRLSNIQKMREEGMITSNDVLRSKLTLTNYKLSYDETNNAIAILSQQLAIALGMNEDVIYEPDSIFINTSFDIKMLDEYIESAYENYPNRLINDMNLRLAKNNLKIKKADYLPVLSLDLNNTFKRPIPNVSPARDLYINSWGVTLNLAYNISSLFDRRHSLSTAHTQIFLQELAKEKTDQDIRNNLRSAYLRHKEAVNRINVLEMSVEQANENYRIMNTKYFNQLAILTDLLDANSIQLNTELQLTNAKKNAIYTYYQLLNISGRL